MKAVDQPPTLLPWAYVTSLLGHSCSESTFMTQAFCGSSWLWNDTNLKSKPVSVWVSLIHMRHELRAQNMEWGSSGMSKRSWPLNCCFLSIRWSYCLRKRLLPTRHTFLILLTSYPEMFMRGTLESSRTCGCRSFLGHLFQLQLRALPGLPSPLLLLCLSPWVFSRKQFVNRSEQLSLWPVHLHWGHSLINMFSVGYLGP